MPAQVSRVLLHVSALAFLALVLGAGCTAQASVIAYEGFDYGQAVGTNLNGLSGGIGWGANTVRTGTAPTGGNIQLDIQTRALADHDTGASAPSPSAIDGAKSPLWPNTSGTTYLCVAEVTNIGGSGTETLWILGAANYDAIKAGGITRAKLVANNIATATKTSSDITLDVCKYSQLGCHHWHEGTSYLTVDETKFATALTEVLAPVRPGAASPPGVKPAEPPPPMQPASALAGDAQWQAVPLVPQAVLDAEIRPGGEGGQWPQAICIDPVDGKFLLYGTDVGGIFRSLDGGKTFEPCNMGYTPRGNCGFAIDPVNINRALAIGANSLEMDCHGIYLTTDKGASWTHVLPKKTKGYRDFREQVAFDKSSYEAGAGCCKVAYWSAAASSTDRTGRLYKSADGGKTWAEVADSQTLGGGIVKVHPAKGYVYVANGGGLFKSIDGGNSFAQTVQGGVTGMDVVGTQPDMVFACKGNEVLVSKDAGETFTSVTPGGFPAKRNLLQIRVSAANVNRMVIENNEGDYQWRKYYSTDGGKTWALPKHDNRLAILPYNPRQPMFAMHPKDEQVAWSFGGDWITRTTDGGATWAWANNGNNGIMVGGRFNFNVQDPDLLYFSAVDYNGALTTDGGRTWTYINMSQIHWGGSISAGYAATPQILYGVMDNRMRITRDGGKTVTNVGGVSGARVSYGAPTDPNVLFCCNLRSTDQGQHWPAMNGCDGVYTSNPAGDKELYGRKGKNLVKSADRGATWTVLASLPGEVGDVAYDHVRNRVYATSNEKLYQYDADANALKEITPAIPADQFGARRTFTVAVDPVDPSVVYAGGSRDVYSTDTAVVRSTDAGQTWQSLIRSVRVDNVKTGPDGGREAIAIRVHPKTRYAYVGTGCYGFWKFGPPAAQSGSRHADKAPASEPKVGPPPASR